MATKNASGAASKTSGDSTPAMPVLKSPSRLMVDELPTGQAKESQDQCAVELHPDTMKSVPGDLMKGDDIILKGKTQSQIIVKCYPNPNCEPGSISMNDICRRNLRVKLGDMISVHVITDMPIITEIELAPAKESIDGLTGVEKIYLWDPSLWDMDTGVPLKTKDPPFLHAHRIMPWDTTNRAMHWPRVLIEDQLIRHTAAHRDVWFKVVKITTNATPPAPTAAGGAMAAMGAAMAAGARAVTGKKKKKINKVYGMVKMEDGTTILKIGDPVDESKLQRTGYADVGGLSDQIVQIREMVELPLRHPKLFKAIGAKPPKGVLMHGPPGCGKTLIARAISYETGAAFITINGPEIMSAQRGGAEKNLRDAFKKAKEKAEEMGTGAIVFIDEIDSIAPNREKVRDETLRRVVTTLLTEMDGLNSAANLMVIGATNRPNTIDPALRRSGRFDAEICIPVPSTKGRLEILNIVTRKQKKDDDVDLKKLAEMTHGYVGADLAAVAMKAAMACIRRSSAGLVDMDSADVPAEFMDSLSVTMADYQEAIKNTGASTIRDVVVSKPNVSFKDIGGLENVKKELKEMINFPSKYEDLFADVGIRPPTGALMYGPPGCGKTLLAKAMAAECDANFISIKGPQLLTKWFGESEENIRGIFEKARQSAPCVLFFDELDSIATKRGGGSGDHGTGNRIVNQLLTEMDGIGKRKNVFIIGATNRPDTLDPAILRPGRLDQKIHIPMPDEAARLAIFKAQLRKTKVDSALDWDHLAKLTDGYSGSDLAGMLQLAVKMSVRQRIKMVEDMKDKLMKEKPDMKEKDAMAAAKKAGLAQDWPIKADFISKAFTLQRKSISKAKLKEYDEYAERMQIKMGIKSQLTTNDTAVTGMFQVDDKTIKD